MFMRRLAMVAVVMAVGLFAVVSPAAAVKAAPEGDNFRGFVEQRGDHYDYVGSPCPVDAEACILAIYTYRIVPVTPQAARALDRVSGGVARLTGVLESTGDAEHQGTLYVWRIGGGGGR